MLPQYRSVERVEAVWRVTEPAGKALTAGAQTGHRSGAGPVRVLLGGGHAPGAWLCSQANHQGAEHIVVAGGRGVAEDVHSREHIEAYDSFGGEIGAATLTQS